ncbi:hypothetical protein KGF54_005546 [Candida jiufengensis]|uniref:uncharacterized protein n=1 Tax=Candida jiufengensis TaxID=497108 RepID=UPI0022252EA5|nr:uncharacterized protein KGF54_005546 [Candida jiufengensis]KAI5949311.1 hypothetical protein KGF54_005546 [Candida jiufengensis]
MLKQFTKSLFNNLSKTNNNTKQQVTKKLTPSITIYHNNQSILSNNLLKNLESYSLLPCTEYKQSFNNSNNNTFYNTIKSSVLPTSSKSTTNLSSSTSDNSSKFNVDIKIESTLSKDDYDFILKNCLDIHPENNLIMLKLLLKPNDQLLLTDSKNSNKLLKNFELLEKLYNYENFKNLKLNSPLIIDYQNKLLGNCNSSFNRIIVNYLNCGIQNISLLNHQNQSTSKEKDNDLFVANTNNVQFVSS